MSKSSRKKRKAARKREELDRLRGLSLLDQSSPGQHLDHSPNPEYAANLKNYGKLVALEMKTINEHTRSTSNGDTDRTQKTSANGHVVSRPDDHQKQPPTKSTISTHLLNHHKRIDFVLPRTKLGANPEAYLFKRKNDDGLPTTREEGEPASQRNIETGKRKESIDDILFPSRKRRLAEQFEAIHENKIMEQRQRADSTATETSETSKTKKRKRRRSRSGSASGKDMDNERVAKAVAMGPLALSCKNVPSSVSEAIPLSSVSTTGSSTSRTDVVLPSSTQDQLLRADDHRKVDPRSSVSGKERANKGNCNRAPSMKTTRALKSDVGEEKNQGQLSGRSVEEAVLDKQGLRPRANSTDGELKLPQRGLCDERMVLQSHAWNDAKNYVHHMTPKGFVNLGNTCFLNATLQCLAHCPPFCQTLITMSKLNWKRKNGTKLSQGQRITSILCSLFQRVHGFNGSSPMYGAIAPHSIVKALPTIGTCGSRNGYKFRPGRQEDAHELLVHLLDAMYDGELRAAGINQHVSGWRDRLPVLRLDETTFVHRIFGGYFRSQVRCSRCGFCSNTYDPFLDLSLEVSKKASNSIRFAMSHFTRKETLDKDNQWRCSGCKEYVCATKQLTVFRPPLSLCIQLKRFAFDGGFGPGRSSFSSYGSNGWNYGKSNCSFRGGSKITKPIDFPATLDLPLSDSRHCVYLLTGVVVHVGGSASSGHYTAYVRKPGRKESSQWYHADDSFIEPVSEKTVLRQKDAYVLFYTRKEVRLEFPSPPPRSLSAEQAKEFGKARARARTDSSTAEIESDAPSAAAKTSSPIRQSATLLDGSVVRFESLPEFLNKTFSPERVKPEFLNSPKIDEHRSQGLEESTTEKESSPVDRCSEDSGASDSSSVSESSSSCGSSSTSSESSNSPGSSDRSQSSDKKKEPPGAVLKSSNNDSTSSSSEEEEENLDRTGMPIKKSSDGVGTQRTTIVMKHSDSKVKITATVGPRKKRFWKSKMLSFGKKGAGFDLLGNMGVSRWDDGDEDLQNKSSEKVPASSEADTISEQRSTIVKTIEKQERSRKRKMHLDRWDAILDQGRAKKLKTKSDMSYNADTKPMNNAFQKIQSGIQRMNKGKAKRLFHRRSKLSEERKRQR